MDWMKWRTPHDRRAFAPSIRFGKPISRPWWSVAERQRLALQNAVVLQPLTQEQVLQEVQQGGAALASLHAALRTNRELRTLATSPLMLSVLVLTYHDMPVPA